MQPAVDIEQKWADVLKNINKDQIPIGCVKKILFKLKQKKQKTLNLSRLRKEGVSIEEMELVIARYMYELTHEIDKMDFIIDVDAVANYVQPMTDEYLKDL